MLNFKLEKKLTINRQFMIFLFLILLGVVSGALGSLSLSMGLGEGLTAFWPGMAVQVLGGIWFGIWGVLAGVIFPIISNGLVGGSWISTVGFIPANFIQAFFPAWLYRQLKLKLPPRNLSDYLTFIFGGVIIPALLGSLLSTLPIFLAPIQENLNLHLFSIIISWTIGNALPAIIFGLPLLIVLSPVIIKVGAYCEDFWGRKASQAQMHFHFSELNLLEKMLLVFLVVGILPDTIMGFLSIVMRLQYLDEDALFHGNSVIQTFTSSHFISAIIESCTIFLALFMAGYFTQELSNPLEEMAESADKIGRGDLNIKLKVNSADVIGKLALSFNRMTDDLKLSREKEQELIIASISTVVKALEARDRYTRGHSERVAFYGENTAREMNLSEGEVKQIALAGKLHDIGKIGINDAILLKPGSLTKEEFQEVQNHPQKSVEILSTLVFLREIFPFVSGHHERFDGKGYPKGLEGRNIPLGARILAAADTYDALTTTRPYRQACDYHEAVKVLKQISGTQLDPECVEGLLKVLDKIKAGVYAAPAF